MRPMKPITRRSLLTGAAGLAALASAACASASQTSPAAGAAAGTSSKATEPMQSLDMHADTINQLGMNKHTPYSGFNDKFTGTLASANTQVSGDRMGDARWVQCYSIWIPDPEGDLKGDIPTDQWYREAVEWFKGQMELCTNRITQVKKFSDIPSILDEGKVAAILTVENGACLSAGMQMVDEFERDGVLIAGITWNYKNVLGSGNNDTKTGLTDLGKQYVAALEDRNIVVDVSHLNEKGFWDVEKVATKPYVATHSNARAVCDHLRNLTDEQFAAIMARGGVVGLNLYEGFVRKEGHLYSFDELAAHVEHWLDVGGEDIIALGSDRDGSEIPTWLADCSSQEYLYARFVDRFGETVAKKLFFENAMRFFGGIS